MNSFNEKELKNDKYKNSYSDSSFWNKLKQVAKKVGSKGVFYALVLYYVLQKKEVPKTAKAVIIGTLGYFIFPLDLIPDITPIVGYSDDIGALLLAMGKVSLYIDDQVKNQARKKLQDWFNIPKENL